MAAVAAALRGKQPASLCLALLFVSSIAVPIAAEPLRVHLRAGPAVAVSSPQSAEFGWGASATGAIEFPFTPQLGVAAELNGLWLADGAPPDDDALADPGAGGAVGAGLAVHLRPFTTGERSQVASLDGLWLSASFGVITTGGQAKSFSEFVLGWDDLLADGYFGFGPYVGLYHVFQPDDQLRPQDANIVIFGLHVALDTAPSPPLDSDGDGISDVTDKCPMRAEDRDGYLDTDGCPDEDNDRDGILDVKDRCPNKPEDIDRFEDDDGCPDLDNDGDGLPDVSDQCPNVPEDFDGDEDVDGCPDTDRDQDGISDAMDACPDEPETNNGYADHDGCPDAEQVRVVGDRILLDDKIHFRTNSWIIRRESYQLLESLRQLIFSHPEYVHIAVHGHADVRGDDKFNQYLSERRAKAVMEHLVTLGGLNAARFSYKGFGSAQPLAEGRDHASLYLNRRVEFKITREIQQTVRTGPVVEPAQRAAEPRAAHGPDPRGSQSQRSTRGSAAESASTRNARDVNEDGSVPEINQLFPVAPHLDDAPAELPVLPEVKK